MKRVFGLLFGLILTVVVPSAAEAGHGAWSELQTAPDHNVTDVCIDLAISEIKLFADDSVTSAGAADLIIARMFDAMGQWAQFDDCGGDGTFEDGPGFLDYVVGTTDFAPETTGLDLPSCPRNVGGYGDANTGVLEFKGGDWDQDDNGVDDVGAWTSGCVEEGEVVSWVVRFNSNLDNYHGDATPGSSEYDTYSFLVHEFGHVLTSGHFLESDAIACPGTSTVSGWDATRSTMCEGLIPPGKKSPRTIDDHDKSALDSTY